MEKKSCKKSNDSTKIKSKSTKPKSKPHTAVTIPPVHQISAPHDLQTLRQDANIQIQVEKRLQELASLNKAGTKLKSLRGGSVEVLVPNRVKWPHEYVLSGNSKYHISYDQLSVTQWVASFGRIMKEERNSKIKDSMLDYLVALFDYANDFSWDAAKASHAVLLCRMEQGEIANYNEVEKNDRIRRANAQRHTYHASNIRNSKKMKKLPRICHAFFTTKALATNPESTRSRVLCTGIFVLHVLPMAKLLLTQRSIAKINLKKFKKRISLGAHLLSTHAYSHRIFYNSKIPNATYTSQTTKKQAFHWYNTWAAFQKVRPHKTYVQALLTNSAKKVITRDVTNVLPTSATKAHYPKARPHVLHVNVHPPRANPVKNNHANTGKRQRTVPNNLNVPVPLHNRFQVLNNFDAEREASVQIGIMQCDSNIKNTDTSMVVAGDKRLEKHS